MSEEQRNFFIFKIIYNKFFLVFSLSLSNGNSLRKFTVWCVRYNNNKSSIFVVVHPKYDVNFIIIFLFFCSDSFLTLKFIFFCQRFYRIQKILFCKQTKHRSSDTNIAQRCCFLLSLSVINRNFFKVFQFFLQAAKFTFKKFFHKYQTVNELLNQQKNSPFKLHLTT